MGNIKSFCCREDTSDVDDRQERVRILSDNSSSTSQDNYDDGSGSILSKADCSIEQSALDKIYQRMVANVIDVAPCESMVIQPAEFIERQKTYQARLNLIRTPLMLKSKNSNNGLPPGPTSSAVNVSTTTTSSANSRDSPQHVGKNQEKRRVEFEPISMDDIQLINDIGARTLKALKGLKVNSQEPVVIRFHPLGT